MRKLFIIAVLMLAALPAFSIIPPDAAIIQVHDMQYIKDQSSGIRNITTLKKCRKKKTDIMKSILLQNR